MLENKPKYIILHHSKVSRTKNSEQYEAVRSYHIAKGWGDIGYHFFIEPDGIIMRGRDLNEAGAHCKEQGMNMKSIGVCLAGDFDTEAPTEEQLKALKNLLEYLRNKISISREYVLFHNDLANYKTCPGTWWTRERLQKLMTMKEVFRDEKGGHWFIKYGDGGKQKLPDEFGSIWTVLGREFGVQQISQDQLDKLQTKKYF